MKNQWRGALCAVCAACLALAASGASGSSGPDLLPKDDAAQVSGLKGRELAQFKANMEEVLVYDREIYGRRDVSASEARRMTTRELIRQTCRQNLHLLLLLYPDHPRIALYRASRCSNSLAALLGRRDFAPAFLGAYSSFDPNPKTHPNFEKEGGLFGMRWILALQGYPALKSQLAGHEREILRALCRKYREVEKVNASYPKGQHIYSTTFFGLDSAQFYARKVFPKARILSVHSDRELELEPAVRELERLCGP